MTAKKTATKAGATTFRGRIITVSSARLIGLVGCGESQLRIWDHVKATLPFWRPTLTSETVCLRIMPRRGLGTRRPLQPAIAQA